MRILSETPAADELREVKFKVTSEEESERVQNAVFVAGGEWGDGSTSAEHKDKMFLLVSDSLRITYTTNGGYFSEQHYEEVSLPEIATPPEVGALIDPPQLGECIGDTQDEQMYAWFDGASKINNYLADFMPVTKARGALWIYSGRQSNEGALLIGRPCSHLDNEHTWKLITESEMIEMAIAEDKAREVTADKPAKAANDDSSIDARCDSDIDFMLYETEIKKATIDTLNAMLGDDEHVKQFVPMDFLATCQGYDLTIQQAIELWEAAQ